MNGTRPWGTCFAPEPVASLEVRMWKAYDRRQGLRLLVLDRPDAAGPACLASALALLNRSPADIPEPVGPGGTL